MERRKIAIKTAVFLLSICMLIVSLPLTTAYATKLIPDKYFGTYDNETDPTAMLVLSSGPTVAFKGVFYGYGRIAAANATAIYFDPLLTDAGDNFACTFNSWSKPNDSGGSDKQQGTVAFSAYYNNNTSSFKVRVGKYTYEYYST